MPKKIMQDMKSGGVRITRISKDNIKSEIQKPSSEKKDDIFSINRIYKADKVEEARIKEEVEREQAVDQPKVINNSYQRESNDRIYSTPHLRKSSGGLKKSLFILFIVAVILGGGYYVTDMLHNVKIDIVKKEQPFDLAKKQLQASKDSDKTIDFEIMIVSGEDYKDITLTETKDVSYKAHGEVTFYNEFSTKAQTIAKNSYISDKDGKVYLTDKAITIPGYKTVDKKIVAGQAVVGVTSFLAGAEYNNTSVDYKVNAFKKTAKEMKIYAKLKTPITGGAQGVVYMLGEKEKESIKTNAESAFRASLVKKVQAEVPPGYILYPEASQFLYNTNSEEMFDSSNAKVKMSGTVTSLILNEKDLSKVLINNLLPEISKEEFAEINIEGLQSLKFSFAEVGRLITKDLSSVDFTLSGSIKAIWATDVNKLKSRVMGVDKGELPDIFKDDPGIVSATARIFPPWYSSVPEDASKIKVNVK